MTTHPGVEIYQKGLVMDLRIRKVAEPCPSFLAGPGLMWSGSPKRSRLALF